jgi:HD-GYP domain-containing protein (c-di-GMP phosphodiesterase class II)
LPLRSGTSRALVVEELNRLSGSQFDPAAADVELPSLEHYAELAAAR